jgi:tetratricopeptide (TPR) repeat protein
VLSTQGDLVGAERLLREAVELARQSGDREREAMYVLNLGYYALVRGDLEGAEPLIRQSVEVYGEIGDRETAAFALMNFALLEFRKQRYDEALQLTAESLETGMAVGSKQSLAYGIECVAAVAAVRGQAHDAASLLASAAHLRDEIELQFQPYEQALHEGTTALVEDALDDDALAREREKGHALIAEESYAYALAVCESLAPRSPASA